MSLTRVRGTGCSCSMRRRRGEKDVSVMALTHDSLHFHCLRAKLLLVFPVAMSGQNAYGQWYFCAP